MSPLTAPHVVVTVGKWEVEAFQAEGVQVDNLSLCPPLNEKLHGTVSLLPKKKVSNPFFFIIALCFILFYNDYTLYDNILSSRQTLLWNTILSSTKPFPQSRQGCLLPQDTPRQLQHCISFSWNCEMLLLFDKNKPRD